MVRAPKGAIGREFRQEFRHVQRPEMLAAGLKHPGSPRSRAEDPALRIDRLCRKFLFESVCDAVSY
jgi:hypothetical protein